MEEVVSKLLASFVSIDELRPALRKPFKRGSFVCASDGHYAIVLPESMAPWVADTSEVNMLGVLPRESECVSFTASSLRTFFDSIPQVEEKVEEEVTCDECDGDGFYECGECGNDANCPDCDGTGKVQKKSKPTGRMIRNERAIIMLFDTTYYLRVAAKVLEVADALGCEEITLLSVTSTPQPQLFGVGDARVCIMPCRYDQAVPVPRFNPVK